MPKGRTALMTGPTSGIELGIAEVRTVAFTPTMDSVAMLAMIVAIRTFLSRSLALDLVRCWPWQRRGETLAVNP